MNENEFKKTIETIQEIKLGRKEKDSILKNILNSPIVSPYSPNRSRFSYIWASVAITGALATFLLYSSGNTLPGDVLYPVKINVSEPLQGLLNITPESKAQWDSTKAIRRLDEAADLALKGKLTTQTRSDIENMFNTHVDSFNNSLSQAASSTIEADLLQTEFEANISARVKVFESLGQELDQEAASSSKGFEKGTAKDGEKGVFKGELKSTTTEDTTASSTLASSSDASSSSATASSTLSSKGEATTSAASTTNKGETDSELNAEELKRQNREELRKLEKAIFKRLKQKQVPIDDSAKEP